MGIEFHGRHCSHSHGAGLPFWGLQISPRTHLDTRRLSIADDFGHGLHWAGAALRPRRLLGAGDRSVNRQPRTRSRSRDCEVDAGWSDHSWRDSVAIFCSARLRDSRIANRFRGSSSSYGAQARNQRMADARPHRETSDLRSGISRTDQERWGALLSLCHLERSVLRGFYYPGGRRMRVLLWPIWADRQAGSDDHPDGAKAGLLFPVAVCFALAASAVAGNASASHRPGRGDSRIAAASISLW